MQGWNWIFLSSDLRNIEPGKCPPEDLCTESEPGGATMEKKNKFAHVGDDVAIMTQQLLQMTASWSDSDFSSPECHNWCPKGLELWWH